MKVLVVIPYFYPSWHYGGPPRVAFELARHLVKEGVEVSVYTSDVMNGSTRIAVDRDETHGIPIRYFRNRSHAFTTRFSYFNPQGLAQALHENLHAFDLVHIHEFRTLMTYHAVHAARAAQKPCFLQPHGGLLNILQHQILKTGFDILFGDWILQSVNRVLTLNSQENLEALRKSIAPQRLRILPNGVAREALGGPDRAAQRTAWRLKNAVADDEKLVLYMGRLHKGKGVDLLIETLAGLTDLKVRLVIAGPDFDHEDALKELIAKQGLQNRVLFLNFVEGEEKQALLAAVDLLALPSVHEGLPMTVLEAMASEVPVVVTKACNLNEIAAHGAGRVIERSTQDLATALREILSAPEDVRRTMGSCGRRLIEERYTWPTITAELIKHYNEVL